jgi:hypothetical protein
VIGQSRHFVGRVADVDQRNVQFVAQAFQPGQEFLLAGVVQRGQRLVHQEQARRRQQGTGDRNALLLAAGKPLRQAVEQRAEAEQLDDGIALHRGRAAGTTQAEIEVARHVQMREQPRILEHIAQRTLVGRHETRIILPGLAVHDQPAGAALQPGDAAQQRGLAAARLAEQRGDAAARQVEIDVEREAGPGQREAGGDAHERRPREFSR